MYRFFLYTLWPHYVAVLAVWPRQIPTSNALTILFVHLVVLFHLCYFSVSVFPTGFDAVPLQRPRICGSTTQNWGILEKNFRRFAYAPNFISASAPMVLASPTFLGPACVHTGTRHEKIVTRFCKVIKLLRCIRKFLHCRTRRTRPLPWPKNLWHKCRRAICLRLAVDNLLDFT